VRDIILAAILFGSIPFILRKPMIGLLLWNWLAFMNPHRLTYGFAFSFDWSELIVVVTLVSLLLNREQMKLPWSLLVVTWIAFVIWANITTLFALFPEEAYREWERFLKIQLMVFLTLLLLGRPERIRWLVWVIALSIGFFGIKGGFFSLMTGGQFMVRGPPGTFIEGNNEVALAIIVVVPLLWYLREQATNGWLRLALLIAVALCLIAVISTYSRGALLGGGIMSLFLFAKSKRKVLLGSALALVGVGTLIFMPAEWLVRMETISTYEEDRSAMGRVNAWWFAVNLAIDRPLVGGGFNTFQDEAFLKYAPEPENVHDSHSIYFEVLGEQGFVGLFLYLSLAIGIIVLLQRIQKRASKLASLKWASDLAAMMQVSFVGFGVGGLFLGLAYFDLPFQLFALTVLLAKYVDEEEQAAIGRDSSLVDSDQSHLGQAALKQTYRVNNGA
jgi:putative inorganic carbon (HCO3(-)) transporter